MKGKEERKVPKVFMLPRVLVLALWQLECLVNICRIFVQEGLDVLLHGKRAVGLLQWLLGPGKEVLFFNQLKKKKEILWLACSSHTK